MNIKYTVLALALAASATTVNASVELKSSDDGQLLINGVAAQVVPHVHDASGQIVAEFRVIEPDRFDPDVLLNISGEAIDIAIGMDGSFAAHDRDEIRWILYDEECQVVGLSGGDKTFIDITAVVMEDLNHDSPTVYKIGSTPVEGWLWCDDGVPAYGTEIGVSITYSPALQEALENFMNSLEAPLSIK